MNFQQKSHEKKINFYLQKGKLDQKIKKPKGFSSGFIFLVF